MNQAIKNFGKNGGKSRARPFGLLAATAVLLTLAGCAPTTATRGNFLDERMMADIRPGEQTQSDVMHSLGSPTTRDPFNENIWYYIGQKTEKHGIFDPEIVAENIVMVTFGADGFVDKVEKVDRSRLDIPVVKSSTPTYGNERTILQDFFGNLGRFNPPVEKTR